MQARLLVTPTSSGEVAGRRDGARGPARRAGRSRVPAAAWDPGGGGADRDRRLGRGRRSAASCRPPAARGGRDLRPPSPDDAWRIRAPATSSPSSAASLNRMLARLAEATEQERRFVADASHELRTPLANLRTEVDLALRRARTHGGAFGRVVERPRGDRSARPACGGPSGPGPLLRGARAAAARVRRDRRAGPPDRRGLRWSGRGARRRGVHRGRRRRHGHRRPDPHRSGAWATSWTTRCATHHAAVGVRVAVNHRRWGCDHHGRRHRPGHRAPSSSPGSASAFSRARSRRAAGPQGGAGLGLAIVRAIVEAHGGRLAAENAEGGGAQVTISLPADARLNSHRRFIVLSWSIRHAAGQHIQSLEGRSTMKRRTDLDRRPSPLRWPSASAPWG